MNLAGDIETAHCSNPNTNKIAPHWIFCTSNPLLHLDMWGAVPTNGGIDWQKTLDRRTHQQKEKRDGAKTLRSPTHIWGYWGTNPRSKNTQTETEKGSMVLKSVSKNKQTHTHSYKKEKKRKKNKNNSPHKQWRLYPFSLCRNRRRCRSDYPRYNGEGNGERLKWMLWENETSSPPPRVQKYSERDITAHQPTNNTTTTARY